MTKQMYFEDVEEGMELPSILKPITTRKLVKYAGASRDFSEIHYDQDFVGKTMWGQIIVQGMLKAGCIAHLATDFAGAEGLVLSMGCTYRAPDYANQTLVVRGLVVSKEESEGVGTVACDAWVENAEGHMTTPGQFVVALPSRDGRKVEYPAPPSIDLDRNSTLKGERLAFGGQDEIAAHIGEWWTPWVSEVAQPWITAFADAVGDPNPLFRDPEFAAKTVHQGVVAPPTFVEPLDADWRRFELGAESQLEESRRSQRQGGGGGDGWCDFNWYGDIHPGDVMKAYTRWTEPYEKTGRSGKLLFTTRETVTENQHGRIISTSKRATVSVIKDE